jgi:hypothetical protein
MSRYGMFPGGDGRIKGAKALITAAREKLDLKFSRTPNPLDLYKIKYVERTYHDKNTPVFWP